MSTRSHHQRRIISTTVAAVLVGAVVTGSCADLDDSDEVVIEQRETPPWACENHTTLADTAVIQPLTLEDLAERIQPTGPQRGLTPDSLESLGMADSLVGTRQVGPQDEALLWRSPQYHDCQDLIEVQEGQRRYTTRAGVMATVEAQLLRDQDFVSNPDQGHRLAFVRRLAGGDYANLLLDRDSACVYVGAGDDEITAPWWATVQDCVGPTVQRTEVPEPRMLAVTRLTYPGHSFDFTQYPPVARWQWDGSLRVQTYGFKCGAGWCLAGAEMPSVDTTAYGSRTSPQEVIHGWRDEQYLADTTAQNPADGRPSDVYSVIVPSPRLGQVPDLASPFMAGFIQVTEHPSSPSDSTRYTSKYGFDRPGRYPVRLGGGVQAGPPGGPDTTVVRITHPQNAPTDRIILISRLGTRPVATARWAWSLTDEEQWWGCPDGCCESAEDGFNGEGPP